MQNNIILITPFFSFLPPHKCSDSTSSTNLIFSNLLGSQLHEATPNDTNIDDPMTPHAQDAHRFHIRTLIPHHHCFSGLNGCLQLKPEQQKHQDFIFF